MKSDVYTETQGIEYILSEVERVGRFCNLIPSDVMKLRLLAEEMAGMAVRLFDDIDYEFYVENEDRLFTLNLTVKTLVSPGQKGRVMSLSKSGKNEAEKGFLGKIGSIFGGLIAGEGGIDPVPSMYKDIGFDTPTYFSMAMYNKEILKKTKREEWDGIEKSIIEKLAKDVLISVSNNKVRMSALIEF